MVQSLIVQSFRNCGPARRRSAPTATGCGRSSCCVSDLRAFQLNRGDGPDMVRVRLDAQLLRMPRARPGRPRELRRRRAPRRASGIDAVVAAFDEALGRVMKELVAWTIRTGNRAGA